MKLQDAIDEFLLASRADGLKVKTLTWYNALLGKFAAECQTEDFDMLRPNDIRRYLVYLRDKGYSEETIKGNTRALHRFFKWISAEYDVPNPMRNIKYPKHPEPNVMKAISHADIERLLATCDGSRLGRRDKAIIAFLTDTGCRVGGLCGLLMRDLDLERGRAFVYEKGDQWRAVFLIEPTIEILKAWLEVRKESETVFHTKTGQPMRPNTVLLMLNRRKEEAGIQGPVNPHAFRHGFGRDYVQAGGSIPGLMREMGHRDLSSTQHYARFTDDEIARAHQEFSPMRKIKRVQENDPDT